MDSATINHNYRETIITGKLHPIEPQNYLQSLATAEGIVPFNLAAVEATVPADIAAVNNWEINVNKFNPANPIPADLLAAVQAALDAGG